MATTKPILAKAVVNIFIKFAKDENKKLTNMQLQMLTYIAQGYTLAITDEKLYYEDTMAWRWGPVIIDLYQSLQKYGQNYVTQDLDVEIGETDPGKDKMEIIKEVYKRYGGYSGYQLCEIIQKPKTPWSEIWNNDKKKILIIPKLMNISLIKEYYTRTLDAEKEAYLLEKN